MTSDINKEHKTLMLLSLVNFLANLFFFLTIYFIISTPEIFNLYPKILTSLFTFVGLMYYIAFLILLAHYTPIIRRFTSDNKDLFYFIVWISVYIIGFYIFYKFISEDLALEIFGSGVVVYILYEAVKSFKRWKNKKLITSQSNQSQPPINS